MSTQIAPHEGRELELVLASKKPLAVVEREKDSEQYAAAVARILADRYESEGITGEVKPDEVIFFRKGYHRFYAEYMYLLQNSNNLIADNGLAWYQQRMGKVFGYTDEEIAAFIAGDVKCNCTKCRGMSHEPE